MHLLYGAPYILRRGLRTAGDMCTFTLGSDDLVNARYPAASSRNAAALAKCGVTELPPTRKLRQLMVSYCTLRRPPPATLRTMERTRTERASGGRAGL